MGFLDRLKRATEAPAPDLYTKRPDGSLDIRTTLLTADDGEDHEVDIVGESHYQDEIRAACKDAICGDRGYNHETVAILIPEPGYLYDSNSVQVFVATGTVGYVARPMAELWQPILSIS